MHYLFLGTDGQPIKVVEGENQKEAEILLLNSDDRLHHENITDMYCETITVLNKPVASYDDCMTALARIDKELDEITDHMYNYESVEDTESNPTTEAITHFWRQIHDNLGELSAICNRQ